MKRTEAVLPALALAVLLFGAVGTASAATPGYAAYSVQVSYMGTTHAITVNESVSATSNAKYDQLVLSVVSGNSTLQLLPVDKLVLGSVTTAAVGHQPELELHVGLE